MMTPEQRYLFDVTGYLHLENVMTDEELKAAQEAANEYINTPTEELPPGFNSSEKNLPNGFAFAKPLEALTMHRSIVNGPSSKNSPITNRSCFVEL